MLAMLLRDAGRTGVGDTVLGTDVSARALAAAAVARYGEWSLRELPAALRSRHLVATDGALTPAAELRGLVRFRRQNLVHDPPPGSDFDLVVCRNVLLYFRPATAERVVRTLAGAVRPGGLLVLGPIEEPLGAMLGLEQVDAAGAALWRRPRPGGGVAR
jgi:chemotaxis protein methyltransferase CheR